MSVYVDNARVEFKRGRRSHMAADNLQELHAFALAIGVHRCWYHRHPTHPHYDVSDADRLRAVAHGAHEVTARELLRRSQGMQ